VINFSLEKFKLGGGGDAGVFYWITFGMTLDGKQLCFFVA